MGYHSGGAMRALLCVWISLVAVHALSDGVGEGVTSLEKEEVGAAAETQIQGRLNYAYFCTAKGDMSPDYAYRDQNCLQNGKPQACGEVWCCGGAAASSRLYSCTKAQRVTAKLCTGIAAPICQGPKPNGKGGLTGCADSHDAICKAAKLYGHCKHASYGQMCAKSCGRCSLVARSSTNKRASIKKVIAQVKAKKMFKKVLGSKSKAIKKAKRKYKRKVKKSMRNAKRSAKKTARKASRAKAREKKAEKKLRKVGRKERKKVRKAKKKAKKKLRKTK